MEKWKPSYSLSAIKAAFASVATLRMTTTAQRSAIALGFSRAAVVATIQGITPTMFYKSMTTLADSKVEKQL